MDETARDAIAKVTVTRPGGSGRGTAFLVSADLVATALHNVADRHEVDPTPYGDITLQFPGHTTRAALVGYKREADCAVLRCVDPPRIAPLQMRGLGRSGEPWQTWGYPNMQSDNGLAVDGTVTYFHGELFDEKDIIQLYCNQVAAGVGGDARGLSGSPVLVNGQVAGIMRYALGPAERATGGVLYACPIWKLDGLAGLVVEKSVRLGLESTDEDLAAVIGSKARPYARHVKQFVEITRGPADARAPYARRDTTLRELQAWYQSGAIPRFLLIAPAGRGKSAVLVEWLLGLAKPGADAAPRTHVVFVPISLRVGTYMPGVFFQMLACRLAAILGRDVKDEQLDAALYYEGLCGQLCDELIAKQVDVLIVIDGVDEAPENSFRADWFSGRRGSTVKLVLSARDTLDKGGGQFWLNKFGWQADRTVVVHELPLLDGAAVRDLVSSLPTVGNSPELVEHVAARLSMLTRGEPLLLRFYAEDILEQAPQHADVLELLQDAAPGLSGYFDHWWSLQRAVWKEEGISPDVDRLNAHLAVMACAFGALGADDLGRIVEAAHGYRPGADMRETLWPLRRFVIGDGQSPGRGGRGYVLAHPGLRDFFLERFSGAFLERIREAFVAWASGVACDLNAGKLVPSKASVYAVSFLTQHLDEVGAPPEDYFRLFDLGWVQAWEQIEGGLRGLTLDVERAERAAMRLPSPNAMINSYRLRARLLLCSIRNVSRVPPELLIAALDQQLLGRPQVEVRLELLEGFEKVRGLCDFSTRLPDDERDRVLGLALDAAKLLSDPQDKAMALAAVASLLPEAEAEAVETECLESANEIRMLLSWYDAMRWIIPKLRRGSLFAFYKLFYQIGDKVENWQYFVELLPSILEPLKSDVLHMALEKIRDRARGFEYSDGWPSEDDGSNYPRILLSPYVGIGSAEELDALLTEARSYKRAPMRAQALAALLPFLAAERWEAAIDEIVETAIATSSKLFLLERIRDVLPFARGAQKVMLVDKGWDVCRADSFSYDYLATAVPYSSDKMRLEAFDALLRADKGARSKSFELLAAGLSRAQVEMALMSLRANRDEASIAATLLVLAGHLDDAARDSLEARTLPVLSRRENVPFLCSAIAQLRTVTPRIEAHVAGFELGDFGDDRIEQVINKEVIRLLPQSVLRDTFDHISSQDMRDPYYFRPRALAAIFENLDEAACCDRASVALEEEDDWIRVLLSGALARRLSGPRQATAIRTALAALAAAPLPDGGREAILAVDALAHLIEVSSASDVRAPVDAKISQFVGQRPMPWAGVLAPLMDRVSTEDRQALWSEVEHMLLEEAEPAKWLGRSAEMLPLAPPAEKRLLLAKIRSLLFEEPTSVEVFMSVDGIVGDLPPDYEQAVMDLFLSDCDKQPRDQLCRAVRSITPLLARLEGQAGLQNVADGIEAAQRCFP